MIHRRLAGNAFFFLVWLLDLDLDLFFLTNICV